MEGKKKMDSSSSSSSFTSDLFGSKESSDSSSAGIFGSIFAPNSSKVGEKKRDSASQVWNTKPGTPDTTAPWTSEGKNHSTQSKEIGSFYQEEKVQPCHLSSSIYYGGQDIYSNPQQTQSSEYSTTKKDGEEDDSNSASRGNWWQGSLYY